MHSTCVWFCTLPEGGCGAVGGEGRMGGGVHMLCMAAGKPNLMSCAGPGHGEVNPPLCLKLQGWDRARCYAARRARPEIGNFQGRSHS